MLLVLLSVVPVGLCLSLLAFGTPERPLLAATPRSYAIIALATVVIGPGALGVLGIVGWLLALVLLIAAFVVLTSLRGRGGSAGRRRGGRPLADR